MRTLKGRILSAINDTRYNFMFSSNTISDTILETVAHIFRIPGEGKPISVFQLSGIPSEVVNSVVSVLCRMSFELAVLARGSLHMLVVCEEAHRYVPADPERGFFPTRQSIAQIAKEGRKYGISLGVISQRPSEPGSDHPVAMLDRFRHAALERDRPEDHPFSGTERIDIDHQFSVVHRQW